MKVKNIIQTLVAACFIALFIACSSKTATKLETEAKTTDKAKMEQTVDNAVEEAYTTIPLGDPIQITDNPFGANVTIPMDPDVKIGKLENGLTYYILKNEKPENRAELRLALNAGSILEDNDQQGLAHFVEHMCFNGTKNFNKSELVDYLESVGTRFGPDLNAYTSFDETVYMLQVRTDDKEMLDKGMLILQDWAGAVTFDDEEIDKERGVVLSEWRTRLSAAQRMQQETYPKMYYGSRYAERLPIGKPDIIQNAPYDALKRFYRDWYRPDLMAVVVVGDVDPEAMEVEIAKRFSQLKNPANPRPRKEYGVPGHKETIVAIASDEEASSTNIQLMYKHKDKKSKTMKDYRENLIERLYNGMLNARLGELAQKPNPPFLYAFTGYYGNVGDLATYSSFAAVPEGGALDGLEAILEENLRVQRHGFTTGELDRQKAELISRMESTFKEKDKTESSRLVMKFVYHFLDDNPIPSIEDEYSFYQNILPTITLDEVNQLAAKWVTDINRAVVITGPDKPENPLPAKADVLNLLETVDQKTIEPYEDEVSDEPLLAEDLQPVNITALQTYDDVEITKLEFPNGVEVFLKPTDFKNDEILMSATSDGGHSLYSDEDYQSASAATGIIRESGIGNFDAIQLEKKLSGKNIRLSPFISELSEGMSGNTTPKDLETMLQLVYLYFTAPRKDAEAFETFITRQKNFIKNRMANPTYYFYDQINRIKYDDNPRRVFDTEEDLDQISLDRAMEIYQERFANAGDFAFFFTGNFEVEEMKVMLGKYLGNLPGEPVDENWNDLGIDIEPGKIEKQLVKGKAPKAEVYLNFHGNFKWTRENRYHMRSMIDLMRIKLRESMREDQGGVYGVQVSGNPSKYPDETYQITISFTCDPADVDKLVETAVNDIETTKEEGASEENLQKVKETQRQSRIKDLEQNRFWNYQIQNTYRYGGDLNEITLEAFEELVNKLTGEDIQKAASQYFDFDNFIKISMVPEEEPQN